MQALLAREDMIEELMALKALKDYFCVLLGSRCEQNKFIVLPQRHQHLQQVRPLLHVHLYTHNKDKKERFSESLRKASYWLFIARRSAGVSLDMKISNSNYI